MRIKDLIPGVHRDKASVEPEETTSSGGHPVAGLQQELNRVFDDFRQRIERPFGRHEAVSDVVEADDEVEVSVELPGMDRDDIEVTIAPDGLTVRGEKKIERQDEKRGYYVSERSYGAVYRHLPLPSGVDLDRAEADFRNGVLTVRLPRTEEARSRERTVPIKGD